MKQILLYTLFLCLIVLPVFSGDIATFINLGFSDNSAYFMFAQYGLKESGSSPYADLFIVEVQTNKFTLYGNKSLTYKQEVEPGTNGIGALFNIIEQNIALKNKYNINHLSTGRILYHLMNGAQDKDPVTFRDFVSNKNYTVSLIQNAVGTGKNVESSFYINSTISTSGGSTKSYTIGHPGYKRKGVKNYKIRQIILAPDERSLVFLIEKEEADTTGVNIRYMIETVKTGF